MNLAEETKILLNQYNLRANKKLGQNFLINEEIIDSIIEGSQINQEDVVIEIGPGLGSLTKVLLENCKKVIAIELDKNMIRVLQDKFSDRNIEIIQQDVLKVDLRSIIEKYDSVKVVANLPYYITTPIIMKLLEERLNIRSITVMVQKEVGERLCADPGSKQYGAITVSVKYYTTPQIIMNVPKENFMPIPEVDSCVIKLDILKDPPVHVNDEKKFFEIIKLGFGERRKVIVNAFTNGGISKEKIQKVLSELNIDFKSRAENLSIYDFADISNKLDSVK